MPFDDAKDFIPVSLVATAAQILLVPAAAPYKTVQEMLDFARKDSGALTAYSWPGNIWELENVLERLALCMVEFAEDAPCRRMRQILHDVAHIQAILAQCGGDRREACKILGISATTLWRKLKAG